MYNFAGKSHKPSSKVPHEIEFDTLWKSMDELYFTHQSSSSLENKSKEILKKVIKFAENHHHGSFIIYNLRSRNPIPITNWN